MTPVRMLIVEVKKVRAMQFDFAWQGRKHSYLVFPMASWQHGSMLSYTAVSTYAA